MKKRLVWSRLGGKMEMIKQIGNIAFHFSASIILQCVYSSRVSSCFLVDSNINLINQSVYLLHFMPRCFQCGVPPQRGWCDILSERSPAGLPLLAFIPSPATFLLWAAQSRMRVILPMSPLQCRNPAFWQHPDLLTSPLHRADRIFLCNAFDWPRSRNRKKTRLDSVSGLREAALRAVFVCCCNYLWCVF